MEGQHGLGDRIRAAYQGAGLNRSQFVRALGVAYSTVLHWEHGRTRPNTDNLRRISEITGLPMSALLGSEKTEQPSREALVRFLGTTLGRSCTGGERTFLSGLDFGGTEPTLESYHAALLAYRLAEAPEDHDPSKRS